jgi:glycosyltransferase involved in cell wall biosynthesis
MASLPESIASHLIIEPFYGGSHKQLLEGLIKLFGSPESVLLLTLPAKKWKWRLRTSSAHFSNLIPEGASLETLFCSSMLNLAELLALREDLRPLKKIVYFHENQFEYPVREEIERDGQFGWSQALSALCADKVLWNSYYNLQSFLAGLKRFIMTMPKDQRPNFVNISNKIMERSVVTYFPIDAVPPPATNSELLSGDRPLHIVWNHRWEWDKGPDILFRVLGKLINKPSGPSASSDPKSDEMQVSETQLELPHFHLSIIGESFGEMPPEFKQAETVFSPYLRHWGYMPSKAAYFDVLHEADLVISTALHEFFGVAIIEAILCNCFPLCPNRLVFPEYLSDAHLYKTEDQLAKKLRYFIKYPQKLRQMAWKEQLKLERFSWPSFETKLRDSGVI